MIWLVWFYGITTIECYLMPNPFYTYISNIYHFVWFCLVLWHINHCRLFNTKSSLYIYIKYIWFGWVGFYGISTIVVHFIPSCEQYWTSPCGNTPQGTIYTATCLPSRKLYKLDEPDTQDTVGEARTNSSAMYSYGPPHMAKQKQDDQLEHTYSSYVRIRDVALKTCQMRWMIGRSGERGSEISVLAARHDDHDDDFYTYISNIYDLVGLGFMSII